jgi:hypothetical protein
VQPAAIDLARRDEPDGDPVGAGDDRPEELLAPLGRELLRVVQKRQRADAMIAERPVVEQDARDDERPCQ